MDESSAVTSVVTIEDLTNSQIEDVLDLAAEIDRDRDAFYGVASRHILASLFSSLALELGAPLSLL